MGMICIGRRLSAGQQQVLLDDPKLTGQLLHGDDAEPEMDLDKAWHGIHYLLTGSAWEIGAGAGAAILGGEPIGPDGGYGPARLMDAATVTAVAAGLDALGRETLLARFDPDAMTQAAIYPTVWDNGMEEFDDYVWPHVVVLQRFYRAAADEGQAVLLAIV